MVSFSISDMTCGHCVASITRAVKALAPDARLNFDLATHRIDIESTGTDASALGDTIRDAGYTPALIDDRGEGADPAPRPARRGCCCG